MSNPHGLLRLGTVAVLLCLAVLALFSFDETIQAVIRWIDHLFAKPGLSGVAMLALAPVAFLLGAFTVRWVIRGFAPPGPR